MKMGLREANQRFSSAMRAVRAGEDVILTERGRPLAVIRRLDSPGKEKEAARLRRMVDEGLVRPAVDARPMPAAWPSPIRLKGPSITTSVFRDREEHA